MSKRPLTPLAMAVPATKGSAYVPEPIGKEPELQPSAPPLTELPEAPVPLSGSTPPAREDTLPSAPAAMNFKLTREASLALRAHHFKTGRSKQAIVEEALNQWLSRNTHLIGKL